MSNRGGAYDLYARNANGTGDDELLVKSPHTKFPACWAADAKFLVYAESGNSDTRRNTWVLPMEGNRSDGNASPHPGEVAARRLRWITATPGE
jgi:hypothetical protein